MSTRKKALWTQLVKRKPDAKAARKRAYRELVKAYLSANWLCRGLCLHRNKGTWATEVHHKNGRLGDLLMDVSLWIPVCRKCHNWIHEHPEEARRMNLLAAKGQWNRKPPATKRLVLSPPPCERCGSVGSIPECGGNSKFHKCPDCDWGEYRKSLYDNLP